MWTRVSVLWVAIALSGAAAQGGPIVYDGDLTGDLGAIGTIDGGSLGDPASWDFWTFEANVGDEITIMVLGIADGLSPIVGLWFGLETDTTGFTDMFSDGSNTTFLGSADGGLPDIPGLSRLTLPLTATGRYTIAVADDGASEARDQLYTIALEGSTASLPLPTVPEPGTLTLLGLGSLGLAVGRLRRRKLAAA